ncbi:cohesin loading factor-domain-containing protein [Achaetomium macrosporum]|uniref:Cohesin loading factor-domain-containing protein n=1 Tax=Achaetomium macrosporum TaxID=79813 RepID=A0AAN7CI52_9PEZI|nr:cohesin loading factor-domain-containing protein [Achaetomium macrosporum]
MPLFSLAAGLLRQIRDITWPADRMPPDEAYSSQGQLQHQQPQQLHQQQFQQVHQVQQLQHPPLPPLQPGLQTPPPLLPHPQYATSYQNSYQNGNQQYQHQNQHVQYAPSPYAQQPTLFYPSIAPPPQQRHQQQYPNYNGSFHQPVPASQSVSVPVSAPMSGSMQFVDPAYLQQARTPQPFSNVFSSSRQPPASPLSANMPALAQSQQQRQPLSQAHAHQPMPVKASPKMDERRPPSPSTPKLLTQDSRRLSSSAGVAKSPAIPQASSHIEMLPLLLCVAEDCFEKANAGAQQVARSMSPSEVAEHHKLVATGLGCLNIALKSNKLWPRLEARLCLRYASVLIEETTNIMEAETTLTRGISVCETHRFLDLKYSSQFLLMKTLFQRNQKAAFKSIEGHITDCTTHKHVPWIYAFRFLKAAFHLQSGTAADNHSVENLRKIAATANQRGDKAIFVLAMLLEGLAHLNTMKDDWATRVQMCIAQASKLQLDESIQTPQTDVLLLLLDLACSLHQKTHQISAQKMGALQRKLEELKQSPDWSPQSGEMLLPVNRMQNAHHIVSHDTGAILRPGDDRVDYLVISTLGKQEAWALAYVFNGIVAHYKASTPGRSSAMWGEAVRLLEDNKHVPLSQSLPEALKQVEWTRELICYAHILTGLQASTLCDWAKVKACLETVKGSQPQSEFLDILTLYLEGVFHQGTASLDRAMEIWKDRKFEMDWSGAPKADGSRIATELSILAVLNRLWIMQEPDHADNDETAELVNLLRPICEDNPDQEIRTVYNLVLSSIRTKPPLSVNQIKRHIQQSLSGAQQTSNTQYLSIALNIMRCKLFENVVGEQALKSAKAGSAQARKSGNVLWMSVADGMLAQSFETQGALAEAKAAREAGVRLANEAFAKAQVYGMHSRSELCLLCDREG